MITIVRRLVCVALLLPLLVVSVRAQVPQDFFGAFESIVKMSQEQQQQKRAQIVAIKRLQKALTRLGFYRGRIDGDIGPSTEEALSAYYISIGKNTPPELSMDDVEFVESQARLVSAPEPAGGSDGEGVAQYSYKRRR